MIPVTQGAVEQLKANMAMAMAVDSELKFANDLFLQQVCDAAIVGLSEHKYTSFADWRAANPDASIEDAFEAGREFK